MTERRIVPAALYVPINYTDDGDPQVARMPMGDGKQAQGPRLPTNPQTQ